MGKPGSKEPIPSLAWNDRVGSDRVETLRLRPGMTLLLSDIPDPPECALHHQEAQDMFGIGFHLRGGSTFDMSDGSFSTKALDVWVAAAPRGAPSSFRLPGAGFRTISLQLDPQLASEWFGGVGERGKTLASMAAQASSQVGIAQLAPLTSEGVRLAESMFTTAYSGAARTLFLESCALGLLAAQFDALEAPARAGVTGGEARQMAQARAYLDAHLDDPPTLVALARVAGVNDFKLKRAFRECFGTTVFGYVRQRRMERAATHLAEGLSVGSAAQLAGYECPRCFADAYRRHFAVLPSETLRSAKAPARHG